MVTGTSSTSKMRWPAAIARCSAVYCIESMRTGSKNRCTKIDEGDHDADA